MVTGNMLVMFIVGFIIFCFYLFGLLYSIYWGHSSQRKEMENDPELRAYYNRHHNYDSELGWGNPHVKEDEYVRKLFTKKKGKSKKNVGKKVYWD
tara:strand:- start:155 stop:439 length:285 start_codon:yes stop_codon:yes gene_type:complete